MKTKKKLTKTQTAIAIAKDVIKQLNAKKFIAKQGTYISARRFGEMPWEHKDGADLQEILLKKTPTCKVCALGSIFVSKVRLADKFTLGVYTDIDSDQMRENLGDYFSEKVLLDIEDVFEGDTDDKWNETEQKYVYDYPALVKAHQKLTARNLLFFIMNQIIAQRGHFSLAKAEKAAQKLLK